ncbi:MAG TPA: glycosyl hydrolase family 28 protein, partial [Opitutales bacterium]|nr:glycosyl hydrolase family 28 protein [Opitutales bacterium]
DIVAALPVIPDATFNLGDYGAVGDFKTDNTDAFKKAIAAVTAAGGGHLIVPEGMYKTLPFTLASHMDLHLNAGAVIKAPETFADYGIPDPNDAYINGTRYVGKTVPALISGTNLTDVAITGPGTIDGSGKEFWRWSDKDDRLYPAGRPVVNRPRLVVLSGQRIHVEGVTLTNSPMFHLVPSGSDITIENIRIVAPSDAPNSDAMDPNGQRIVIRNCEIDTGDDDVAIGSGSHDILIEGLTCLHGHGISIGSNTARGVYHMIVRNCTFDGTDNGLRIKSYRGGGGEVHDITYSNITMKNVRRPFDINMLYDGNTPTVLPNGLYSDVGPRSPDGQRTNSLPYFHDIHISNLNITGSPIAGRIVGLPEKMPFDITFTNVTAKTDRGFLVQDGTNITFTNVKIDAAVGDPLVLDNGTASFNGESKTGTSGGPSMPFYGGN